MATNQSNLTTTHNTVNKLEQLSKRHKLNFDKLTNYVRLEYAQSKCKTMRHFVSTVEQVIVVNNNNIHAMLK